MAAMPEHILDILSGFSPDENGLGPGYSLQNKHFKVTFKSVSFSSNEQECRSRGFEKFYNWRPIMQVVLDRLTDTFMTPTFTYDDMKDSLREGLFSWCFDYNAFGLVTSLSKRCYQKFFIHRSSHFQGNWNTLFSYPYAPEALFVELTALFEKQYQQHYFSLFPDTTVTVRRGASPRLSVLTLHIKSHVSMQTEFVVEKLQLSSSLTELTANIVRQSIQHEVDLVELGLPSTLKQLFQYLEREKDWTETFYDPVDEEPGNLVCVAAGVSGADVIGL